MAGKLFTKITAALTLMCVICVSSAMVTSADELSDYQKRQNELDAEAAQYQSIIDSTSDDIEKREEYRSALQSKITVLNNQIADGREEIKKLDGEIIELQDDIDRSRSKISDRMDKLRKRVRVLYMSGETSSLEIILGAKDFNDFADKLELVTYISRSDQKLINSLRDDIEVINEKRSKLQEKKTALQNEQNKLNSRQKELQQLNDENNKLLNDLYSEKAGAQDHLDETNAERKVVEDQITAYYKNKDAQANTSKIASEAQKNLTTTTGKRTTYRQSEMSSLNTSKSMSSQNTSAQSTSSWYGDDDDDDDSDVIYFEDTDSDDYYYSEPSSSRQVSSAASSAPEPEPVTSSGYVWPVPGHYILSSVWNEDRDTYNHGAIDISDGSIMYADVVAAESGVVILWDNSCEHNYGKDGSCGCGGGYGRYIMIDHGNGKATLYGHLSDITVNLGDYVQKGQLVGYVGSTGWSTGPHLHFETRLEGVKYNPMTEYPNF